jgi:hypothetical protein
MVEEDVRFLVDDDKYDEYALALEGITFANETSTTV